MVKKAFLQSITDKFGVRSANYAHMLLHDAGLPIPDHGQYYETEELSGKMPKIILFLEPYGIAFRFYEPFFIPESDYILQPLTKYEDDHMDVDIVPIVPVGIDPRDVSKLCRILSQHGIGWGDAFTCNAGYVGQDHAVVIDLCESITYGNLSFGDEKNGQVQDQIFSEQKTAAQKFLGADGIVSGRVADLFVPQDRGIRYHSGMLTKHFVRAGDDHPQTIRAYHGALSYARAVASFEVA